MLVIKKICPRWQIVIFILSLITGIFLSSRTEEILEEPCAKLMGFLSGHGFKHHETVKMAWLLTIISNMVGNIILFTFPGKRLTIGMIGRKVETERAGNTS